jgi:hypothetical protein
MGSPVSSTLNTFLGKQRSSATIFLNSGIKKNATRSVLFAFSCVLLYSTIIQPSTHQIRNKQSNITVLTFVYYVQLLHVSIQLDRHQAIFMKCTYYSLLNCIPNVKLSPCLTY